MSRSYGSARRYSGERSGMSRRKRQKRTMTRLVAVVGVAGLALAAVMWMTGGGDGDQGPVAAPAQAKAEENRDVKAASAG
ncbi:MAG: hypothetical protein VYC34_04885, partial [Planctomycetota bacterium]|nr:hypothetical protein [Planctomycetota bacterium]